jgi:predicted negative regulator of RcsB-dependent stress response
MVGQLKNKRDGDTWLIIIIFLGVFIVGNYIGYSTGKKDTTAKARVEFESIMNVIDEKNQVVKEGCEIAERTNNWQGCFKMLNILAKKHKIVYD